MSLEDFFERELENIEKDLVKPKNWGDDSIRNYLLGWKEALQEVKNEMGKRNEWGKERH